MLAPAKGLCDRQRNRYMYLVQLVDALLHAADGGHSSQSVSIEISEAVLPADLKQGHHSSFLWTNTKSFHD